jgi:hypothetical protein
VLQPNFVTVEVLQLKGRTVMVLLIVFVAVVLLDKRDLGIVELVLTVVYLGVADTMCSPETSTPIMKVAVRLSVSRRLIVSPSKVSLTK